MLFTVIFILLLIGVAVVGSIYSNFLVFFDNFEETQNYNRAYYEAIAALERAELVIKQRDPGYVGNGGWRNEDSSLKSDSDKRLGNSDFSYVSKDKRTSLFWTIDSLTDRMPAKGKGNVDYMLGTGDSVDYNMMDYQNSEIVLLSYDDSDGNPYEKDKTHIAKAAVEKITGKIRLPERIKPIFSGLDVKKPLPGNVHNDDAIVDWQLKGKIGEDDFTIFARQDLSNNDSAIRESDLNKTVQLNFGDNRTPLSGKNSSSGFVVVSSNTGISMSNFRDIFQSSITTNMELKLSLLNILQSTNDMVYPFLEYYLDFSEAEVPDKFYTINAEGKFGDFQVNLLVKKPTIKQSVLGSFTVVF